MKKILIGLSVFFLCSCVKQAPVETDSFDTNMIKYFKDSHGICYAAIASLTYGGHATLSITTVPCDAVDL